MKELETLKTVRENDKNNNKNLQRERELEETHIKLRATKSVKYVKTNYLDDDWVFFDIDIIWSVYK